MLLARRLAGLLGLALLPLLAGCTESRPSIERWTGCVFENATRAMEHGDTVVKPGTGSFLYAYANWGPDRPGDDGYMGELEVDFPGAPTAGVTRELGRTPDLERTAAYRERRGRSGSPALVPRTLTGTVRVLDSDARSATLAVDLFATDLVIDDFKQGPATLKGTIKARKVASMLECYARR